MFLGFGHHYHLVGGLVGQHSPVVNFHHERSVLENNIVLSWFVSRNKTKQVQSTVGDSKASLVMMELHIMSAQFVFLRSNPF